MSPRVKFQIDVHPITAEMIGWLATRVNLSPEQYIAEVLDSAVPSVYAEERKTRLGAAAIVGFNSWDQSH